MWILGLAYHILCAREYYHFDEERLRNIALRAACAGAELLPFNPGGARDAAHASAQNSGLPGEDIVFVKVAGDKQSLTIGLSDRLPTIFALLPNSVVGRYVTVSAHAFAPTNTSNTPL